MDAVVIEMAQSERESPFLKDMIAACGTCVIEHVDNARAVAVVTWVGEAHREVRIEVGLRPKGQWLTRQLELKDSDPMAERWRAVGLVIATLVDEEERAEKAAPPPPTLPPPPPPPPTPTPPPPPPPTPRAHAWLDLTAFVDSNVTLGGTLRAAWYPARAPIFVTASIGYGTTPVDSSGVRADSIAGALGVGASYDAKVVVLDVMLALRVERIGASVEGDAKDTVLVSGLLSVDFVWRPVPHFGVVVGGDAVVRSQNTIIQLRDVEERRILPFGAAAHLGARVDF